MATKRKHVIIDVDADGKTVVTTPVIAPVIPITQAVTKLGAPGYFSRVVSNVKRHDMDVQLGACTAIVSERNRAGKTAVLDAFRLALTGKHPIGPDAVDLVGLTPDGSPPRATITGDVSSSSLSFLAGKKTPVLSTTGEFLQLTDDPVKLLPMVSNRDLLTLGTAKAREGLFRRFGEAALATATTAPAGLSPEQVKLWNSAMTGEGRPGLDTVDQLATAGTWIRSHKRGLSAKLKALEDEKQRLHDLAVSAGAGAPTDDLLNGLQKQIDTHKAIATSSGMRQRAGLAESRLMNLIEQYQTMAKPMASAEFEAKKLDIAAKYPMEQLRTTAEGGREFIAAQQKNVRLYTMLLGLRKHLAASGDCLVCVPSGHEHDNAKFAQLVTEAEGALKTAQLTVQALEHSTGQDEAYYVAAQEHRNAEFNALEGERSRQTNAYERLLTELKAAKATVEADRQMLAEAGVTEAPTESLEALQQQLAAAQNAKAEAGRATQLAVEMRKLTTEQEDTKTTEKSLGAMLNNLVAAVQTSAQGAINQWMPSGFKAALMLEDEDGKAACRWEIVGADGRPHPRGAASGAEWAALQVAIACAWSEGQKFRFLLLDDSDLAGFSAENVKNALTMVSNAVKAGRLTQALVAWSRPMEIPSEGWSMVTL